MKSESYTHIVITLLLFVIAGNLLILDLKVFSQKTNSPLNNAISISPTSSPLSPIADNLSCPQSCLTLISQTAKTPTSAPSINTTIITTSSTEPTERELYIPLGSGATAKSDWDDLTTTDTLIDTSKYGTIKEAYFNVILKNPSKTGDAQARLYNVTDKHPVWNSEVRMDSLSEKQLASPKISLDTGSKLYRVQATSGLSAQITIDNAKLRLITLE